MSELLKVFAQRLKQVNGENITTTSGNTLQLGHGLIDAEAGSTTSSTT